MLSDKQAKFFAGICFVYGVVCGSLFSFLIIRSFSFEVFADCMHFVPGAAFVFCT